MYIKRWTWVIFEWEPYFLVDDPGFVFGLDFKQNSFTLSSVCFSLGECVRAGHTPIGACAPRYHVLGRFWIWSKCFFYCLFRVTNKDLGPTEDNLGAPMSISLHREQILVYIYILNSSFSYPISAKLNFHLKDILCTNFWVVTINPH